MASFIPKIDFCSSCTKETEYIRITCGAAVCNQCSIAEENDEVSGWRPARSVGYCIECSSEANESRIMGSHSSEANESRLMGIQK